MEARQRQSIDAALFRQGIAKRLAILLSRRHILVLGGIPLAPGQVSARRARGQRANYFELGLRAGLIASREVGQRQQRAGRVAHHDHPAIPAGDLAVDHAPGRPALAGHVEERVTVEPVARQRDEPVRLLHGLAHGVRAQSGHDGCNVR